MNKHLLSNFYHRTNDTHGAFIHTIHYSHKHKILFWETNYETPGKVKAYDPKLIPMCTIRETKAYISESSAVSLRSALFLPWSHVIKVDGMHHSRTDMRASKMGLVYRYRWQSQCNDGNSEMLLSFIFIFFCITIPLRVEYLLPLGLN